MLVDYWPMSSLKDIAPWGNGANLYSGLSYSFTTDRFGNANSAIYFNSGYLQVPSGIYFGGDFTFSAWINLKSHQSYSRIIDFGNGYSNDNVILSFDNTNPNLFLTIFSGATQSDLYSSIVLQLNQWYHVALVLSGTNAFIYINGVITASGTMLVPNSIQRTANYIGKSNGQNPNADAIYDEIQIYQGAMSSADILSLYTCTGICKHDSFILFYYYV